MYLFSEINFLALLVLLALWAIGGYLIVSRAFDLAPAERGLTGLGVGLTVATLLANFLARILPTTSAFWLSAVLTVAIGVALAWPLKREIFSRDALQPAQWLLFTFSVLLFTLINRGLGIFDDYQNLPQISSMALGDIPPHFAFNAHLLWSYHYFLLLVAAQFTRLADAAPWVSLDVARGLTLALTLAFGGMLAYRLTRNRVAAALSVFFLYFVGGARWLLLLLPARLLRMLSSSVTLIGSGADTGPNLTTALYKYWNIQGLGPLPFPFMYGSGLDASLVMALAGYGSSMVMLVLMLLLLVSSPSLPNLGRVPARVEGLGEAPRSGVRAVTTANNGNWHKWARQSILALLLAALALANEVTFAFLYAGLVFAVLFWVIKNRSIRLPKSLWAFAPAILAGGLLALVEGGIFTGAAAGFLGRLAGAKVESHYVISFALHLPAVLSAHLGSLSLLNPLQWLAILAETGLVIFVLPWVVKYGLQQIRDEKWLEAAWIFSILPSLLTVFLEYTGNAGPTALSRMTAHFLTVLKIYAIPLLWIWAKDRAETLKTALLGVGFAACLSGIALFSLQIAATPEPVSAEFLGSLDAQMYVKYWGTLEPGALVFDTSTGRGTTVLGLHTISSINYGPPTFPEFLALEANPDPYQFNAAGYRYVYFDLSYWRKYGTRFDQPCVVKVAETQATDAKGNINDLRQLVDVSACK